MRLFAIAFLSTSLCAASPTPAERLIARAQKAVAASPERPEAYNELAMAYARRARETADPENYVRARQALEQSFRAAPDNFEGRRTLAWVLLGQHEFAQALQVARKLNREMPDDILVYGLLTDAHVELGNYQEAIDAVQWMLDMRPGTVPGLTRAAYVRELIGYLDGAIEFMSQAYQRTSPAEAEDRAWILIQLAHLHLLQGRTEVAEGLAGQALELFPGYHYALAQLAKVRSEQKRHGEAVDLFQKRYDAAPHPENRFELAVALKQAGRNAEAKAAFAAFEREARAEMQGWDNANRELVFYYADHARRPAEALKVAELEYRRRKDVYTLDAYAWALHHNGRHAEAVAQIEKALQVGVRDPKIRRHADAIRAAGRKQAAQKGW
jgi:tetratricopeptide (TPR) repeat protein